MKGEKQKGQEKKVPLNIIKNQADKLSFAGYHMVILIVEHF